HVESERLLAAGHDDLGGGPRQADRLLAPLAILRRVHHRPAHHHAVHLKEPLGLLAARSALAVIQPVDRARHHSPFAIHSLANSKPPAPLPTGERSRGRAPAFFDPFTSRAGSASAPSSRRRRG